MKLQELFEAERRLIAAGHGGAEVFTGNGYGDCFRPLEVLPEIININSDGEAVPDGVPLSKAVIAIGAPK